MARKTQPRISSTDPPKTDGHSLRDEQGQTGGNHENDPQRGTSIVACLWQRFGPGGHQRRSQERDLRADRVDTVQQIAWSWRKACEGAGLSQSIYTPSGHAVAVPRVGRITLGPPTLITLQPRPGQTREGIAALGPSLAAMMGVSEIRVWDLAPGWVTVELVRTSRATTVTPFPPRPPFSDLYEAA